MRENKKLSHREMLGRILFISLIGAAVYSFIRVLTAPQESPVGEEYVKVKSDYLLMLVQCGMAAVVMLLPSILQKRLKLDIPNVIYILYYVFLYCAVFLGEVLDFYYLVPHWDTILHFFSGAMLAALGFILINILNEDEKVRMSMSPVFVSLFAFSFALAAGAVWEIYEFSLDGLMGLNMQKYMDAQGVQKVGHEALYDTMKDIIVDALAALVIAVSGYFSIRKQRGAVKK